MKFDILVCRAVLAVAAGLLAVASEAAALLKWTAASATHQAACVLADRLLQAVLQAKASHAEDAEPGWAMFHVHSVIHGTVRYCPDCWLA